MEGVPWMNEWMSQFVPTLLYSLPTASLPYRSLSVNSLPYPILRSCSRPHLALPCLLCSALIWSAWSQRGEHEQQEHPPSRSPPIPSTPYSCTSPAPIHFGPREGLTYSSSLDILVPAELSYHCNLFQPLDRLDPPRLDTSTPPTTTWTSHRLPFHNPTPNRLITWKKYLRILTSQDG